MISNTMAITLSGCSSQEPRHPATGCQLHRQRSRPCVHANPCRPDCLFPHIFLALSHAPRAWCSV